jgi:hypothetical protein
MKSLLSILTFLLFSTCVPVTYHRNVRVITQSTPVAFVNTQPNWYIPYYGFQSIRPVVRPPYLGNVYHKPKETIIVRGGRRR